ncbi:MAG: hypothetical protein U1E65_00405 [Myxococcota bacterium]
MHALTRTFFLLAGPTLVVACSSGTQGIPDAGQLPVDSGVLPHPDAAAPDAEAVDAGFEPDAEPADVGNAKRHLVDVKLFGDMPLENAVLDPQFDQSSQNWIAVGDLANGGRFVRSQVRDLARSPVGLPALYFPTRSTDPTDTVLLGSVMAVPGPVEASVWIGRDDANSAALSQAHPFVIVTLASSGQEQAFDLTPMSTTATQSLDGVGWQLYSATIPESSLGILTFAVDDPAHGPLYVHAPVVVGTAARLRGIPPPTARARPLRPLEAQAAAKIAEWRRRRLGEAKKAPERALPLEVERAVMKKPQGKSAAASSGSMRPTKATH